MREILFRGQTRRYGEKVRMGDGQPLPSRWVYGGVLQGVGAHSIIYGGENVDDPSEGLNKWPVYTDTLGQFTGLKDKNGKRIFEGDILHIVSYTCDYDYKTSVAAKYGYVSGLYVDGDFDGGDFNEIGFAFDYWSNEDAEVEVIGNIHDNPELLDGERRTDGT